MRFRATAAAILICGLITGAGGCASPSGKTLAQQREYTRQMARDTLTDLKQQNPELASRVYAAPGYAVFSGWDYHLGIIGSGNAYGIARSNSTGREDFMRIGGINLGLGLGAKGDRVVMIFNDADAFGGFVTDGWDFGGEASAVATAEHYGDRAEAVGSIMPVEVYQMSHTGLIAKAVLTGAKAWRDGELNIDPPTRAAPTSAPPSSATKPTAGY